MKHNLAETSNMKHKLARNFGLCFFPHPFTGMGGTRAPIGSLSDSPVIAYGHPTCFFTRQADSSILAGISGLIPVNGAYLQESLEIPALRRNL